MKLNLILLHGLFGNLSNWQSVTDHFSKDHDIHVLELPLFDNPKGDILTYFVEWLNDYVARKNLENIILVGNSLGGHVATLYAHRFPERVRALVLTGSSGLYEKQTFGNFPRRQSYAYIQDKVAATFYDPATATKEIVDDVFETVSDNARCIQIIRTARVTQRNYVTDILPAIQMPALLIWGNDDTITPMHVAAEFKQLLPDATLAVIDKCGHAPMMEQPTAFNRILEAFLDIVVTNINGSAFFSSFTVSSPEMRNGGERW